MSLFRKQQIFDPRTGESVLVDRFGGFRVFEPKRVVGSNFGSSIDTTYLYTTTLANNGTATASLGVATLATGTTANGSASMVSKAKIRYMSGRQNLIRIVCRVGDTGAANNVREWGLYIDSNNMLVFRLSGTTFSVVRKRNGSEEVVNSGSFNGNGSSSGGTYTLDTNFHSFELHYSTSRVEFMIDDTPIHTFRAQTASIISSMVGALYFSNANSGGSTTSCDLHLLAVSGAHMGDSVNNPLFYNIDATAETRTLKSGGGTLHAITIGRLGGANAAITLYDNTAGSGTKIIAFDLTANSAFGTHTIGIEGANFYNGLTYVTSGTMTNGSVTIFWE